MVSLLLFALLISNSFSQSKGIEFLASCPLMKDMNQLIDSTGERSDFIEHKMLRDIKAKLYQSYTNNEITPLSKERLTTGLSMRWEDIFGYYDRQELYLAQAKSLLHGQKYKGKELIRKWLKFYFTWKWGRIYKKQIEEISSHAKQRSVLDLGGLRSQIQKVRWTELLHRSEELLAIDKKYHSYFAGCSVRAFFKPEIEIEKSEIITSLSSNLADKDLRLYCDNEKLRFRNQLAETHKKVKFNFGTSYGINQQLGTDGRRFNDVRAMVDMEISLDTGSMPDSNFEQCDFEIRQQELESVKKNSTMLSSLERFDKNLSTISQINRLLLTKDPWSNFPDSDSISLMQEYVLSIEHLIELDYEISNEILASQLIDIKK